MRVVRRGERRRAEGVTPSGSPPRPIPCLFKFMAARSGTVSLANFNRETRAADPHLIIRHVLNELNRTSYHKGPPINCVAHAIGPPGALVRPLKLSIRRNARPTRTRVDVIQMRHTRVRPQLNNGLPHLKCHDHGHKVATRPGATSAPRIYSRAIMITCARPPPLGRAAHRERVPTREVSEDASVFRGALLFFPRLAFCTVIRRAFCIVPVQASGIFGQVPLACACHSLVRLPCCSRLCAHPPAAAHPPLSALELSLSRLLTRPLATLYLPLSHLHLSPQSPSLNARSRLNMPCFNITSASSGRKHRGHSLPCLFFHPPTFPLGTAPCTA